MKTSISAHTFPSWCPNIISDEDDLHGDFAHKDHGLSSKENFLSVTDPLLTASHERLNAEASELELMFQTALCGSTLPRLAKPSKTCNVDSIDYTANSWPRLKKIEAPGILKSPEKDRLKSSGGNAKTLNFAPTVNLFSAVSPEGVSAPLSRMSSEREKLGSF